MLALQKIRELIRAPDQHIDDTGLTGRVTGIRDDVQARIGRLVRPR